MMDFFVPPQMSVNPPAMVAQAGAGTPKTMKPFTICHDIASNIPDSAWNQFSIFGNRELMKLDQIPNHKVTLLQAPALIAERWVFFAQAKHPQNLYYQVVG